MKTLLTPEQEKCIAIWEIIKSHNWRYIEGLITERIINAKQTVFDAKGEIADFDRGYGTGLQELLNVLDDYSKTGSEILNNEEESES
jgi:hypothetical protein